MNWFQMAYDLDDGMKLKKFDPKRSGRMIRVVLPYWDMFGSLAKSESWAHLNRGLEEGIARLNEREDEAVQAATQEIHTLVNRGARVDTKHEFDNLVGYIAQKHGVDPGKVKRELKIVPKAGKIDDVIYEAWRLTLERLPTEIKNVVKDIALKIEDEDRETPGLDAQTYPEEGSAEGFIIYRNGMEVKKGRVSNIMQIMAHEAWHVFAEKIGFYDRLGDILEKKAERWMKYGIGEVKDFVEFLETLQSGGISADFLRRLKQKILDRKWWGEKYFLDQAETDTMHKVLGKVSNRSFLGAIDELMAEALGRIATGKSLFTPRGMINFVLKLA